MKSSFLIIFFGLCVGSIHAQTIQTQYGPVTGHSNGAVYEFLGIPFASPPVGDLRWKPTEPPSPWTVPILADSFPPKCPQKKYGLGDTTFTMEGQEDCLYLNVWTPDTSAGLPVMVFIHGGGNQQGSASEVAAGTYLYQGKNLAGRGNVVVVTLQYRLGALGYLVHPGLETENAQGISGNYGVIDQLMALQWIQNNIAHFGGNPSNVTIFGESAGGVNVGNLLTAPPASGLFHKAIIQSAGPVINHYDTAKLEGIAFVDEYISTGTDSAKIAFMRTVHPDSITSKMESPINGGIVQQTWQPVLDNSIFFDFPEQVFQTGNFNHVPLMIGSNADEMLPQAPQTVFPWMVTILINSLIPPAFQATAHSLYPSGTTNEEAKQSYAALFTDAQFTTPTRRTAQCVSLNQSAPVWRYFLTHSLYPGVPIVGDWGAYHGIDLFFVFNTWENSPFANGTWFTAQDDSVQDAMLHYWANFAYTGNPNGTGLPAWVQYDAATDCYLEIKASPDGAQCGVRTEKCDFWDDVSGYVICTGTVAIEGPSAESSHLLLYPNPTGSKLNILAGTEIREFKITILNLLGNSILVAENTSEIDIGQLKPGTYFLRMEMDGKTETQKFIKVD
ncbi:MAG: carboxylesterase family protein [Bacteroidales bacterium]|nr:carboxylesterase family protein [Bacteroidales bacterium]MCF8455725.1 carboxylesterase family protein [Bacteroidales bacterium]